MQNPRTVRIKLYIVSNCFSHSLPQFPSFDQMACINFSKYQVIKQQISRNFAASLQKASKIHILLFVLFSSEVSQHICYKCQKLYIRLRIFFVISATGNFFCCYSFSRLYWSLQTAIIFTFGGWIRQIFIFFQSIVFQASSPPSFHLFFQPSNHVTCWIANKSVTLTLFLEGSCSF